MKVDFFFFFQYDIPYTVLAAQVHQDQHELNYLFKYIPTIWKWMPFLPSKIWGFCLFFPKSINRVVTLVDNEKYDTLNETYFVIGR